MWKEEAGSETGKQEINGSRDQANSQRATVGCSVTIKGEITGEEDILIEGAVEGLINLKQNVVTVAKTGRVKANIHGVVIHVEGEVTGDLFGSEKVVVHRSGRVRGNVTAPRISIEDGARVKGVLNTEVGEAATEAPARSTIELRSPRAEETVIAELPSNGVANAKKAAPAVNSKELGRNPASPQ